jgi:valyl-tRNA synthetase
VLAVSAKVAVFLELQSQINVDLEIQKVQAKITKSVDAASKLRTTLNAPDFAKSSRAVQEMEKRRLADLLGEQSIYERYIKQYEQIRQEEN